MAKKNSSKTRTEKAEQASIPQQAVVKSWQGINIDESPVNWDGTSNEVTQGDLMPNLLLIQNNVDTTNMKDLETRRSAYKIFETEDYELTGVSYIKDNYLFLSCIKDGKQGIVIHDVSQEDPSQYIKLEFETGDIDYNIECIYSYHDSYDEYILVTTIDESNTVHIFDCKFNEAIEGSSKLKQATRIGEPKEAVICVSHDVDVTSGYSSLWRALLQYCPYLYIENQPLDKTSSIDVSNYGGAASSIDNLVVDSNKWYIIDNPTQSCYDLYAMNKTYSFKDNLWFESGVPQGLYAAHWREQLDKGLTFDKVWLYQEYKAGTTPPSSAKAPNIWIVSMDDTYLFEDATWNRWSVDPSQTYVESIDDPDTNYLTAYKALSSVLSESSTGAVYGVSPNGDLWVLVRTVRNSTGTDSKLYYHKAIDLPNYADAGTTVADLTIYCAYANKWGQTKINYDTPFHVKTTVAPVNWTTDYFMTLIAKNVPDDCTRVNFYYTLDESDSPQFAGYATPENGAAVYNWYGSMTNTDEWIDANLTVEDEDTTGGPDATQVTSIDGRLYWWGSPTKPYRLFIGGDTGHELSCADGYGGAWLDVEPGIGTIVNGVWKWKTQAGASIVTILCGNKNSTKHKRYNLVENNITISTELEEKSYMFEEIANTVGCQNRWGAGVWQDGLYVLTRYGLRVTTMAMEYNSQIMSANVSNAVNPLFTDNLGVMLDNARMIEINGVTYIVFGTQDNKLDNIILCYDSDLDSWYTYTYGDDDTDILHIMNIDYIGSIEGIGLICRDHVGFIPTTGIKSWEEPEKVDFMIETGALSGVNPATEQTYLAALQWRFDWFVGDMDIDITGVDMYGRRVHVRQHLHTDELVNDYTAYTRCNVWVESYNVTLKGNAMFRLMNIVVNFYKTARTVGLYRGFDAWASYRDAHNKQADIHHYIRNYANLRTVLLT